MTLFNDLGLTFNCNKSCCLATGTKHKSNLPTRMLGSEIIDWHSSVKYLGVTFVSSRKLTCDIHCITREFYAASNSINNNTHGLDDMLKLSMQQFCNMVQRHWGCLTRKLKS